MSFFQGLGDFAAGFAPGVKDFAQQQSNSDFGNALAQIYGGQAGQQQQQGAGPLGSLQSTIQALFGGGQQPQPFTSTPAPQQEMMQAPPISQVLQQGGRSANPQGGMQPMQPPPMQSPQQVQQLPPVQSPQQVQQPQQPPPQAPPQQQQSPISPIAAPRSPPVANTGAGLPQQQASQPQAPPQQPQQTAPPPPPQQQGQQPQARPQQQDAQQGGQGPLDLQTLVKHLVANGVTGKRLGNAVEKFIPLLNAQGLQQYRDLGLQLRYEHERNTESDRAYNRDAGAAGSRAQNRVANQGVAVQRMEGVQRRFETRMAAATDKLKNARTDKEAVQAKNDLDKVGE